MIKYYASKVFAGKYLPPFHEIFVQEIRIHYMFLTRTLLFVIGFPKFFLHILATN